MITGKWRCGTEIVSSAGRHEGERDALIIKKADDMFTVLIVMELYVHIT